MHISVGSTSPPSGWYRALSFMALSPRWDRLSPLAVRRTAVLLTASFRFHLAMDTLAVRLEVPTIRACCGTCTPKSPKWTPQTLQLRPRATRHAGRTTAKGRAAARPYVFLACMNRLLYSAFTVVNVNVVVECRVTPGRSTVLGKFGWFGESGKCCVSRQNAWCLSYFNPCRPTLVPSRKFEV